MNDQIQRIDQLPEPRQFLHNSKALAILDAILMPDWEGRYFSFNAKWNPPQSQQMASMRNGSGDEYFALLSPAGIIGKVYAPHDLATAAFIATDVPNTLVQGFADEPAFALDRTSFVFWRTASASSWSSSPSVLNVFPHLGFVAYGAHVYHEWAEGYYEREIDLATVEEVFQTLRIDEATVRRLNPDQSLESLADDLAEILSGEE